VTDAAERGEGADLFPPRGGDVARAEHLVADLPGGRSGRCESLSARGQPVREKLQRRNRPGPAAVSSTRICPGFWEGAWAWLDLAPLVGPCSLRPAHYIDVLRNVALVGVLVVVVPVRFPPYSFGARDVRLADVFWILKQGLDFFLYNDSIFR
jgi:hypothetical protein